MKAEDLQVKAMLFGFMIAGNVCIPKDATASFNFSPLSISFKIRLVLSPLLSIENVRVDNFVSNFSVMFERFQEAHPDLFRR